MFNCYLCHFEAKTAASLKNHKRANHQASKAMVVDGKKIVFERNEDGKFTCCCGKTSSEPKFLNRHINCMKTSNKNAKEILDRDDNEEKEKEEEEENHTKKIQYKIRSRQKIIIL